MAYFRSHILVCNDPECVSKGAMDIMGLLRKELDNAVLSEQVQVLDTPRIGDGDEGPEILVYPEGYHNISLAASDIPFLVEEQFLRGRPVENPLDSPKKKEPQELGEQTAKEVLVVLRNCGKINPETIEKYIAEDRCVVLVNVLTEHSPDELIEIVKIPGCARNYLVYSTSGDFKKTHVIDQDTFIPSGFCKQVCNYDVVKVT